MVLYLFLPQASSLPVACLLCSWKHVFGDGCSILITAVGISCCHIQGHRVSCKCEMAFPLGMLQDPGGFDLDLRQWTGIICWDHVDTFYTITILWLLRQGHWWALVLPVFISVSIWSDCLGIWCVRFIGFSVLSPIDMVQTRDEF